MDLLSQHEAFLRAIFDAPEDDTPRLVYADFLQENGEEERAEFIRVQCELTANRFTYVDSQHSGRQFRLFLRQDALQIKLRAHGSIRGFVLEAPFASLDGNDLNDATALRWKIVTERPHWFGVNSLKVWSHPSLEQVRLDILFSLAAFARITKLELSGVQNEEEDPAGEGILSVYVTYPTIGVPGVVALAGHKGMRRITELDLRNNDLDNDAARALVKSPYLDNLKRLQLLEGNRFRGRVWQQVIERFGEDVVG